MSQLHHFNAPNDSWNENNDSRSAFWREMQNNCILRFNRNKVNYY